MEKTATRELELRAATSSEELERLRPLWEQLEWTDVDAQLDFFLATLATRDDLLRPHAIALTCGGEALGMLLARIEHVRILPGTRPLHLLNPAATAVVVPGGMVGSHEACVAMTRALFALTRRGRVRAVCFRGVRPDGPERAALRAAIPAALRAPALRTEARWFIDLPIGYEDYFASLSRNLRRARRREATALERTFAGRLELIRHVDAEYADELLSDIESVAARTYQRGRGVGFHARLEPLVRAALEDGLARAWVLRADGEPVAYELGWVHGDTYRGAYIGYAPEFARHGVGGYVEQTALRDLCNDPQIEVYDQGPGDFEYKRRLSNRSEQRTDLWAFQPSPTGLGLGLLRGGYELGRWGKQRMRSRAG